MQAGALQHTLTIRGVSSEEILGAMAAALRADGWTVDPPGYSHYGIAKILMAEGWTVMPPGTPGETIAAFAHRLGVKPSLVYHALERGGYPPIRRELGPKGVRTLALWPTPEFEAWLKRNLKTP